MKMFRLFLVLLSFSILYACSNDDGASTAASVGDCDAEVTTTHDIVATWSAIYIDGLGDVVLPNYSSLSFYDDGAYSWYAEIKATNFGMSVSSGSPRLPGVPVKVQYTFENSTITILDNTLSRHFESNPAQLTFCNNKSIMSYSDESGGRWVYAKQE